MNVLFKVPLRLGARRQPLLAAFVGIAAHIWAPYPDTSSRGGSTWAPLSPQAAQHAGFRQCPLIRGRVR